MASFIRSDLDFILEQILIAERHADGESLTDMLPNTEVSFGLRTIDGSFNNLVAGRTSFGAADTTFPRLLEPLFRAAQTFDPDGPGPLEATQTSYLQTSGLVVDAQPRTISNLVVDQTASNPAAQAAADSTEGSMLVTSPGLDGEFGTPDDREVLFIPNRAPDEGLSAPFNSWMTFFGQFFDHGLDLVTKGGSGTVFIPLQPDDPLYVPGSPTNFMVMTRATNQPGPDGVLGTADDIHEQENTTSPFVDQNQTYSSHPSHQVFLRAYALNADGKPVATGKLITNRDLGVDGQFGTIDDVEIGGMATWKVVKAQARDLLGINLTDADVDNVPLLATDAYGNFLRGPNGFPQVVMRTAGNDGVLGTADDGTTLVEGNPLAPIDLTNAVRTGHQFLIDIAHNAVPVSSGGVLVPDADTVAGNAVAVGAQGNNLEYDNELLDAHYIAGDGRVNENIGLTAVHHIFHAEHNRLVEHTKSVVLADAAQMLADGATQAEAVAFLNNWLATPVAAVPVGQPAIDALAWNGERLFQAAKFGTEMQYQHLVFEEFARTIQPNVDAFIDFDDTVDPSIVAEFAHTVYRFGHSMLTETIDRLDANYQSSEIGLIKAFLNPLEFAASGPTPDQAAGAIIRGVTRQVGNEIDEFVTEALRNNLVGLPLDLAAINIARGRDTGVPSLNAARRTFYEGTGDSQLTPYTSWADFVQNIKHPESLINFIAAYGTHASITSATTIDGKRAAAMLLVFGGAGAPTDRLDFLNSTGAWASGPDGVTITGLDDVDFWIGGLAEEKMPFGGMLGSTFNFVFETQLEALQNGDRFYYLHRTAGMNFLAELENNSFAKLVMLNTDATHLPALIFSAVGYTLEVDPTKQHTGLNEPGLDGIQGTADDVAGTDGILGNSDPLGDHILVPLVSRDDPLTLGVETNYLKYTGDEHVVLGGTAGNDVLISSIGDDTVYGDGGNDRIEGGYGNDDLQGGDGDDIITDQGGDDVLKGGAGNDVIHGGNGLNLIIAGAGNDFIVTGEDSSEVIAGEGNDFILGSKLNVQMAGNEGDDWIEIGTQDGAPGDNFNPFGDDAIAGHDVFLGDGGFDEMIGEGGDDIMVGSSGPDKMKGMSGFDWATYKDDPFGVNVDMFGDAFNEAPVPISAAGVMTRFAQMEGLSGSAHGDILRGDDANAAQIAAAGARGSVLTNLDLIAGLRAFLGQLAAGADGITNTADDRFGAGNIILGGNGSDLIEGRGGDDVIDGDRWLNVRISVRANNDGSGAEVATFNSLQDLVPHMLAGTYHPGQLVIVREILAGNGAGFDTAVFSDIRANYAVEGDNGIVTHADLDGDGFITVRHLNPDDPLDPLTSGPNGTDKLANIERLQFADQSVDLVTGVNAGPAGSLVILDAGSGTPDNSPASGQTLRASIAGVTDADNVSVDNPTGAISGPVAYYWQVQSAPGSSAFTDILVNGETPVSGRTFTVTPDVEGLAIRVRAVYQDANGVLENVFSAPSLPVAVGAPPAPPLAEPAVDSTLTGPGGQGLHLIRADLAFILAQIKIAEAHAAGESLDDLLPNSRVPFGLRTVDGSGNNLTPGRTEFGAADNVFPRLLDPAFRDAENLGIDIDGPAGQSVGDPTSYTQTSGLVQDSAPRTISNLIVDQSINNSAAVQTAIDKAGLAAADLAAISAAEAAAAAATQAASDAQDAETAAIAASDAADAGLAAAQTVLATAQADATAATAASDAADATLTAAQAALTTAQANATAATAASDAADATLTAAQAALTTAQANTTAATAASDAADATLAAAQASAVQGQAAEDAAIAASNAADLAALDAAAALAVIDGSNPGGDALTTAQAAAASAAAAAVAAQAALNAATTAGDAATIAAATAARDLANQLAVDTAATLAIVDGTNPGGDALAAAQAAVATAGTAATAAQSTEDAAILASANADAAVVTAQSAATAAQATEDTALAALATAQTDVSTAQAAATTAQAAEDTVLAALASAQTDVSNAQTAATTAQAAEDAALLALGNAQTAATSAQTTANDAQAAEVAATVASDAADANVLTVDQAYADLLTSLGILDAFGNAVLPNVAPDEGLSAPFNSWMTFFGQFFDHGLDLVTKGGSGTVFIPLQPDDPLYVAGSPTNFMVLTRATNQPGPDGQLGTPDDIHAHSNTTSPFVDQNQTYSSHPSHQVFLRGYAMQGGAPVATGKLITNRDLGDDGKFGTIDDVELGGMATWKVVKAQARDLLGIELSDANVGSVPLLATDAYGNFLKGPNGFPQVVLKAQHVGHPVFDPDGDGLAEGNPLAPVPASLAVSTGHAFLDDIAHFAVPVGDHDGNPATPAQALAPDADTVAGGPPPALGTYDNELLDAHYIAGDGRVNENIGLTAVHHVFHSEHNRLVEATKQTILQAEADTPGFINDWLAPGFVFTPGMTADQIQWNGERLFQTAKFGTEMQYQHLVFEEFARTIQPNIDVFVGATQAFDINLDPSIVAEFAHTVYRFGHSMLTETIDRLDPNYASSEIGLIEAFLNPLAFAASGADAEAAAGAIVRGVTRQTGNEIDEFVTDALRNNLVGLPLDLAAINLARGRDTGVPSLNTARREFYSVTGDANLKPYTSWVDFAEHIKHAASVINFIAAYGTHAELLAADVNTLEERRAIAVALIFGGQAVINGGTAEERIFTADEADRNAFLNSTGIYASGPDGVTTTGVDGIDFWIGGLAEEKMPFGGMLGSTFNFVFEEQMEKLQNADRFYYLDRTAGLNFLSALENNSFAKMIMANTDATHLPGLVFSAVGFTFEVDQSKQHTGLNEPGLDGIQGTLDDVVGADGIAGNSDPVGGILLTPFVIRDNPLTPIVETNYLKYTGDEHVVMGGTELADTIIASIGDDTVWGDGGNDRLEGGYGNDMLVGGAGDDIITDQGGDDNLQGGDGNDVLHGGNGLNLIIGGLGKDFIVTGEDSNESFGGPGDDFILGTNGDEQNMGGEGDDWLEGGLLDGSPGDNFDPNGLDAVRGNDVYIGSGMPDIMNAEGGDDIMVGSAGPGDKYLGASGFDWATFKDDTFGVNIDLNVRAFNGAPIPASGANVLARFEQVEGLAGSSHSDILRGDDAGSAVIANAGAQGSTLTNFALIDGLRAFVGSAGNGADPLSALDDQFNAGNIILGGDGSDLIEGRGGDDLIDGDKWLNVRISVRANADGTGPEIATYDSMKPLVPLMLAGTYNPGQLVIVREVMNGSGGFNFDTAMYSGNAADYTISTVGGVTTVSHLVPDGDGGFVAGPDGSDRLTNIERLQFADQSVVLAPGLNHEPIGLVSLNDSLPAVGQTLTASIANVADGDNTASNGAIVGPISYYWQVDPGTGVFEDLTVFAGGETASVTGPTLTVDSSLEGLQLRVRAVYQDQHGVLETVYSAPTSTVTPVGAVNNAPSGTVLIDDLTPTEGNLLSAIASYSDLDGTSTSITTFQWQTGTGGVFTDISGATSGTFTPGQAEVGLQLRVIASFTDDGGNPEFIISNPTGVVGEIATADPAGGTVQGSAGDDQLLGGAGNDVLVGGTGDDLLTGGDGNDIVDGGAGTDIMAGGAGDDMYGVHDATDVVTEDAGAGVDTVWTNLASYTLGANVENLVYGGNGNFSGNGNELDNLIVGGVGNDSLISGDGADRLYAGAGDDTLSGGAGADIVDGGAGTDIMAGGADNDLYGVHDATDVVTEDAGAGVDTVWTNLSSYTLGANVENLIYGGNGNFFGNGNELDNLIVGNVGNDTLISGDGADRLYAGTGDDALSGGTGADIVDGGADTDIMAGGAGDDLYGVHDATDVVTEDVGAGVDTVWTNLSSYTLGANVENLLYGGNGNFSGNGNELDNLIVGGVGNDTLIGGGGADRLYAGAGDDALSGGTGADIVDGGAGTDIMAGGAGDDLYGVHDATDVVTEDVGAGVDTVWTNLASYALGANVENLVYGGNGNFSGNGNELDNLIVGGVGNDTLTGNSGNDVFVFSSSGFGTDRVTDFDSTPLNGQDLLNISGLGITAGTFGTQVSITDAGADTLVTIGGDSILLINVSDHTSVDQSDFLLA